jgi:very-short-patch-repair endonuclease
MPRDAHPGAKALAREFRKEPSHAEREAWEMLRGRRCLDLKFRRQEAIGYFILDFYCPALQLGVEIDGPTHLEDGRPERDAERDDAIRALGIEVVRIRVNDLSLVTLERAVTPFLDRRRWK